MKKLLNGIVEYREKVRPGYKDTFARLALGQRPDSLFIACSDSRVVPNVFASTDPGDLFVVRNVGNMVAPCGKNGLSVGDLSEAAAIEFAVYHLKVRDIVICGHSECGAMAAIASGLQHVQSQHLRRWLETGLGAHRSLLAGQAPDPSLSRINRLGQINVLMQMEHLLTYPEIRDKVQKGELGIHGFWFDIANAEVRMFDEGTRKFQIIDRDYIESKSFS